MRYLLAALLSAVAHAAYAQEASVSSAELRRHHVSTDVLADAAGRFNLRYAFAINHSGEVFAQAATEMTRRGVNVFDTVGTDFFGASPEWYDAQRVTDVYLGYRQRFGPPARRGRFYVDGGFFLRAYSDFREEYEAALRASPRFNPDFVIVRQRALGLVSAVGYVYELRGGWTVEARAGVQVSRETSEVAAQRLSQSSIVVEALSPRPSSLLTLGKRF